MLTKIKEFLFGKPTQLEVEVQAAAPYKVETPAPVAEKVEPIAKPKAAPKPKTPAAPKAPAKPRAPRAPK
jgi:hypothetical protein